MKYRCIPCDYEFELKEGVKPRCPRCLKIHDIEPVEEAARSRSPKWIKWLIPAAVVLAVGILAAIRLYTGEKQASPEEDVAGKDLESLLASKELPKKEAVVPFGASDAIRAFAQKAASGKDGLDAMRALFDAVLSKRQSQGWTPHNQREPRREKPLTADELLERISGQGAPPWQALSYELACLLLAAARSVELDAHMAEILQFEALKTPADPAGKLGRYGVVFGKGTAEAPPPLFDPYSGRFMDSARAKMNLLTDAQATAPYYGLGALALLVQRDTQGALKLNKIATELAPKNPYFRTGRALIFAVSAAPQEALAEFEKAVKLRDDAVTRTNLAEVQIFADMTGKQAEASIQAALAATPEYGRAHAVLAMIHAMRREFDQAEPELAMADRYDPGSPAIAMFWAQFYAVQGLAEDAIKKAEQAVQLSGESISSLLGLASIYRQTARFEEMRITLDKVIAMSDSPSMATEIRQIFGYEKEEDSEDDTDEPTDGKGEQGIGGMDLELKFGKSKTDLGGPRLDGELDPGAGKSDSKLRLDLDLKKK